MLLRVVLFLFLCLTQCWGQTCDEKRTKIIDETYSRLMIMGTGLKLPETIHMGLMTCQCWGQTCDEKRTKIIDETYSRLMIMGTGLKLPETIPEWKTFCK